MTRPLALAAALAALLLAPVAQAAAPPTRTAGQLTVGVSLPSEGFQVGVVAGTRVVYARGLEIDLAEDLARRLELPQAVFTQRPFGSLLTTSAKPWDVAIAQVAITERRAANVDFSVPYLRIDQGVLLSQFVTKVPKSVPALRRLKLCAQKGSTGADTIADVVKPSVAPRIIGTVPTLLLDLQLGRCDAVVYDLPVLATLKSRATRRYGRIAGRIATGEEYGVVLPKGSPLKAPVDAAITAMRADGTLSRLQRTWLDLQAAKVPLLPRR